MSSTQAQSESHILRLERKGHNLGGGGGATHMKGDERGGDARRKFCIKPLKETDLGGAQAFFEP